MHRLRTCAAGLLALGVITALSAPTAIAAAGGSPQQAPARSAAAVRPAASTPGTLWSTQLDFDNNGTPWSEASFAALKAKGLDTAEIDMPWNTIEPSQGTFNFTELDQEVANAGAAGIHLVPIFWSSGWGGSPANWVTSREVSSTGVQSPAPVWWDPTTEPAYLTYVTDTVKHIAGAAGYGGSILDYGFLDAQWDDAGGASGWAQADIDMFHTTYLPQTYGTIAAFNTANGTAYTSFGQVPAAAPGQPLAAVYQKFRVWSVQTTYAALTADVRAVTSTPLYYYFGGHIGNAVNYANIPDIFFALAKQYNVTVIEDAAGSPGLTLTFGSLARAYGVKLAQEWTAPSDSTQLAAEAVRWISDYGIGLPEGGGEDFFIHDGTQKDTVGWPIYTGWVNNLEGLSGSYPQQPAAVYIDFSQAYGNAAGGNLGSPEDAITSLWDGNQAGFAVVTSQEVNAGVVKLSNYKAVFPVNGTDANLTAYQKAGGTLLTAGSQLSQYAPPYATLANSGVLQVVPTVSSAGNSAAITLADVTSGTAYNSSITFHYNGLGVAAGSYHLVNAAGTAVPQQAVSGGLCAAASLQPASLAEWHLVAGAIPAGTAAPGNCAASVPTPCGTLTANQSLAANQSLYSCDGRFNLILQGDANLVLYEGGTALWASNTSGTSGTRVILQGDGNLVLYTAANSPVWASNTSGNAGAKLVIGNDGNVVITSATGGTLWSTGTGGH
ncbi:Beta-galactosidase [Streptomyces sp. DvalAA-14]|uniref:beta-galactosidase n=1 Tax=unclassified Streptomyces TaxID=2593676 RepID=UPI00081B4716|nr:MULTISPECIES: beta-galactosidase [unclassified Streptomyces]SCE43212.1 Beta-galactosidase [Streptomyces sp. DvalAA-14]